MNTSPLLQIHERAGAQIAGDARTLLTYGDVPAEYAAAMEGAALFDVTDRGALTVSGAEAPAFLHRLLANDVKRLEQGRSQRNLLLSSKGKVHHDLDLTREVDRFTVSTTPGDAEALAQALDTYLFAEKVVIANTTAAHAPLEITGPRADEIVQSVLTCELARAERSVTVATWNHEPVTITRLAVAGSPGLRLDAGAEGVVELWAALVAGGARPAGRIVHDILRVEAGVAAPGVDIGANTYPQEARLEEAYRLDKGCYIGQEVVAKIDTYGGLNKRLVALRISHDDPLPHGTRLFRLDDGEWRDLGVVTSWAYSFVLDTGLVLAYVKRRHQAAGTEFRVGDGPATAVIVPLPVRANAVAVSGEFE